MSTQCEVATGKLRQLQLVEFEILKKVKAMCEQYGLTYYLIGGTLLGAVRHGGFIPWDDDVDIAMPRPDYERFLEIAKDYFAYPFALSTNDTDPNHLFAFARVIDKRTKVKSTAAKKEQIWYSWIDIFALDAMPANKIHFLLRKNHIYYAKAMFKFSVFDEMVGINQPDRPFHQRFLIALANKMQFERFMNPKKQIHRFNKVLSMYPYEKGKYAVNMLGGYQFKSLMEKEVFGKYTELSFEGEPFRVPEKYDVFLTRIYGDYMKLPPEDRRNKHSTIVID